MKFIIEETGQIIDPRGRKFYHPPTDKWYEDKYLEKYDPEKLAFRFGIYQFNEVANYDPQWYKKNGFVDNKNGYVITRTYTIVPKYGTEILGLKNDIVTKEGIQLYRKAIKIEPLLLFTGDSFDLATYKNNLISTYNNAKTEVMGIVNNGGLTQRQKYDLIAAFKVNWPPLPLTDAEIELYGV